MTTLAFCLLDLSAYYGTESKRTLNVCNGRYLPEMKSCEGVSLLNIRVYREQARQVGVDE